MTPFATTTDFIDHWAECLGTSRADALLHLAETLRAYQPLGAYEIELLMPELNGKGAALTHAA